jgi:hypothetical protein
MWTDSTRANHVRKGLLRINCAATSQAVAVMTRS